MSALECALIERCYLPAIFHHATGSVSKLAMNTNEEVMNIISEGNKEQKMNTIPNEKCKCIKLSL